MCELGLVFPFAPLSQNNIERTGRSNNHRYKITEAKTYERMIELTMLKSRGQISEFKKLFNPDIHSIELTFEFHINKKLCLTKPTKKKPSRLSKRGGDYDNYIKFTQDVIFNTLGINDFFVSDGRQKKRPTKGRSYFLANLKIVELNSISEYAEFLQ